ncbi:MAG: PQQ-binding-like beta-propeller repeat protein [Vicinamibacterales bacterium]
MKARYLALLGAIVLAGLTVDIDGQQPSADWPQWRGPNRDAAGALTVPAAWPEQLTQRWKVTVGLGYATPLVVGNRVYMFSRQGTDEVMSALDAANGMTVWQTKYAAPVTMHQAAARHGDGPKATPAFANGRLYSIGTGGIVTAFDAATGRQLWQKPGAAVVPMFTNYAVSPIVDRGLVIFHLGGHNQGALTAFDANTGDVRWQWAGDGPGYGSPIVADLGGVHQIVSITQGKVVGVDAATGTLLWERPFVSGNFTNSMTPLLYGQTLVIGGAGGATHAFTVARTNNQWTTTNAWESADAPLRLSNALVVGDAVFGLTSRNMGQYFSLDAKTGKTLWTSDPRQAAQAAIVRAGNVVMSLQDDGNLVVFRSGPAAFETLKKYKVAEAETWTQPALSGNRIFVKDVSTLALWTLN